VVVTEPSDIIVVNAPANVDVDVEPSGLLDVRDPSPLSVIPLSSCSKSLMAVPLVRAPRLYARREDAFRR
jgi:hypothetical protein